MRVESGWEPVDQLPPNQQEDSSTKNRFQINVMISPLSFTVGSLPHSSTAVFYMSAFVAVAIGFPRVAVSIEADSLV